MNFIQCGVINGAKYCLQERTKQEKEILRTRRKELGLSMNQVAERTGIFVGQYQKKLKAEKACFQIQVSE